MLVFDVSSQGGLWTSSEVEAVGNGRLTGDLALKTLRWLVEVRIAKSGSWGFRYAPPPVNLEEVLSYGDL